jgi:predicted metal-dependent phosphoesterase TrpH
MYNKFDLHIYSKYSSFAINEPRDIIDNCINKGIKGFAVTDLGTIKSWAFLHKLALENNLVFVPGQKINLTYKGKAIGKAVGLFMLDKINSTDYFDVIDEIKTQGALLSIIHPFDLNRKFKAFDMLKQYKPMNRKLRCIETFNSHVFLNSSNILAHQFAEEHNLMETGGSEAHLPDEIGNGFLMCDADNESELLKAIKLRKTKTSGVLAGLKPRMHTLGNKLNFFKNDSFE